jgi:O-methyltransferase involved in polyketide biosynthesis
MLERIPLDLSNLAGRRDLFARLGQTSTRALVISEGLLIYLSDDEVGALARDLGAVPSFQRWVVDIAAPGLLKMLQQRGGAMVAAAGAPYKFGPPDGAAYFEPFGWQALKVSSLLKAGARINRVPFFMKLLAKLPDPKKPPASRPWSAVVLLGRKTD